MSRSAREAVSAVSLDSGPRWPIERHVMLRVEYVVNQVAVTHAGQSEESVAQIISSRLRGLGVNPVQREIQQYALAISRLPQSPPPPQPPPPQPQPPPRAA